MVDSYPDGHNEVFCGEWEAIEKLEDSEKRLAGGLVEYFFDVVLVSLPQREAYIFQVDIAGIEFPYKMPLNGIAPVDANEGTKFFFI
jgi:hypothetical protein